MAGTLYDIHVWMVKHPREIEKYINKWIAVGLTGVITSADSLKQLSKVKEVVQARQDKAVLFTLVPNPEEILIS